MNEPHIIVTGNPLDGFAHFGPFESSNAAVDAADAANLEPDWWVIPLNAPEELPK